MAAKMKFNKNTHALVLRCNAPDGSSHGGFVWPLAVGAEVVAPDWIANNKCGNGLHGWLHGAGDHSASSHHSTTDAKWLVVCVALADIVSLGGKVKFPRCVVHHVGDKKSATDYIIANDERARVVPVIGALVTVGDKQVANVGAIGFATSGYYGTSTSGDYGTSTSGDYGKSRSGTKGEICIRYYDKKADRMRTKVGYIGEDGLLPDVFYKLNKDNEFVPA